MAPVVDLEHGFLHGQAFKPWLDLPVEDDARGIEVFIVHPQGKHEMPEEPFRNFPAHFFLGLEGRADVLQVEFRRIVGHVCKRHVRIEELQSLELLGCQETFLCRDVYSDEFPAFWIDHEEVLEGIGFRQPVLQVGLYSLPVGGVRDEVVDVAGRQCQESEDDGGQQRCQCVHPVGETFHDDQ